MEEQASEMAADGPSYGKSRASRFKFKSTSEHRSKRKDDDVQSEYSSRRRHVDESGDEDGKRSHRESRRRHKHKHRSSREDRHPTSTRDGQYYDPNNRYRESLFDDMDKIHATSRMNAQDAFRESLFDALADDEGAAYWEGVYGQPVHVYPNTKPGPDGKLERMSEEEYADYVRSKMWEKSHQHVLEEREARERARQKRKDQRANLDENVAQEEQEREKIRSQMEESLRRGAERKKAKEAEAAWSNYVKKWEQLKSIQHIAQETKLQVQELIPWPVVSGKAKHVSEIEIEHFLQSSSAWKNDPDALLKIERVRWHPDKMQHRFRQHLGPEEMKSVTAVFQVIDRLWAKRR
ncbi:hypothetical protein GQ44DRAFT_743821 [Phaeosphaeriaceae sp. PMI808]|nr:hypothetical protein GQ44DRAFT_743821 [Phaeosphaeriaceae sp. PMI808]